MTSAGSRIQQFKQQVEEEWRDPRVTAAYRKWDRDESEWGRSANALIIARAGITAGANVLVNSSQFLRGDEANLIETLDGFGTVDLSAG